MTKKVIPAIPGYTETYCDFCKDLCAWKDNYKYEGIISIKQNKDKNITTNYDTCDFCFEKLNFIITNFERKAK